MLGDTVIQSLKSGKIQKISLVSIYIGEIHYHKENKTNGGKQIEFSAESNQFKKKIKRGNK